jgi:NAD(P)-dependent dehydrogenase (short-subunit alcohol dehydrogenase family)
MGIYIWWHESRNSKQINLIAHQSVLITGCDSGFGQAASLALSDLGVTVFATCLTETGLAQLKALRPNSSKLIPILMDVRSEKSVENARSVVQHLLTQRGPSNSNRELWALISNAGIQPWQGVDDLLTVQNYKDTMDVNFYGPIRVIHTFRPLIERSKGRIIFISSIRGLVVFSENGPYATSKHALEAYADALRREMTTSFGVSIHVIQPGGFKTKIMGGAADRFQAQWETAGEEIRQKYGSRWFEARRKAWVDACKPHAQPTNLEPIMNAFIHATLARYPHNYYVVGSDAWILYIVSLLPKWLQDQYFQRKFTNTFPLPISTTFNKEP